MLESPEAGTPSRHARTVEKMNDGGLPLPTCSTAWAGPGSGLRCNGCNDIVGHDENEFEVDLAATITLRFHSDCYKAWALFVRPRSWRSA